MPTGSPSITEWLVVVGPLALLLAGLPTARLAGGRALPAAVALAAGMVATAAAIAGTALLALRGPTQLDLGPVLGFRFDALTAAMQLLIGGLAVIIARYARRYLAGEPGEGDFHRAAALSLGAASLFVAADNLLVVAACWVLISIGVHRLLVFYPDRRAARMAARQKFVMSRIGDACMLGAIVLLHLDLGSLDFDALFVAAQAGATPASVIAALGLVVLAALIKSAQLPFHVWLPEVVETPTPVSALLHAGIVNAGGYLLIRLSPALASTAWLLDIVAIVGVATAVFGTLVMQAQVATKSQLAWSTVAQMGFLMLLCGLGAWTAAALHLVLHSLYKAHAFLASGELPAAQRPPSRPAAWVAIALLATLAIAQWLHSPADWLPAGVVLIGIAQLAALASGRARRAGSLRLGVVLAIAVTGWISTQHWLAMPLLAGVIDVGSATRDSVPVLAAMALLAFAAAAMLPMHRDGVAGGRWRALHVHLANGCYGRALADRLIERFWPIDSHSPAKETAHANAPVAR